MIIVSGCIRFGREGSGDLFVGEGSSGKVCVSLIRKTELIPPKAIFRND